MKKLLLLFLLLPSLSLNAQNPCDYNLFLNFEDTNCLSHLSIDTTHFKHNIWQIGHAEKAGIDSLACKTKVIVTDTMHPYPVNDTSVFIIKNMVTPGFYYDCRLFSGQYYVQTDSLKDFGKIEFSADHGTTWIDIINNSAYSSTFQWYTKPVLTGHSRTCKSFDGMFCDLGSVFHLQIGDTVMFRFSFISDSIFDNSAGLMFDNFEFIDFIEGISEIRFTPIKSMIFPNPGKGVFTIEFDNPQSDPFELAVYDIRSKLLLKREGIKENKVVIDTRSFYPDTYIYKLTDLKAQKRCWGKFIIAH